MKSMKKFHVDFMKSFILDVMSLRAALIYDAIMTFATAIQSLGKDQVITVPIRCDEVDSVWNKGFTILNYMKNVNYCYEIAKYFSLNLRQIVPYSI